MKAIKVLTILFILSGCVIVDKSNYRYPAAIKAYGKPTGYVNDFEGLFSDNEIKQIDSIILAFELSSSNQIAIVTVSDIKPYESMQNFTTDLGNYWGIGQNDIDNGLIITVSSKMKSIWIGTGLGTEKILTDDKLKSIIDVNMIPYLKNGQHFQGIKEGLTECIENWKK